MKIKLTERKKEKVRLENETLSSPESKGWSRSIKNEIDYDVGYQVWIRNKGVESESEAGLKEVKVLKVNC